ncbi:MAG: CpsD/CapB family tyrosine-protein kinase, partial [Myxococcota bacterium]
VNKRRISILQPESFASEQFRMLRGRIDALSTQQRLQTVSVTSANPGDGKSMASINLAVVTAMSVGRKVLLIDCDLRKPKIHTTLALELRSGLAEVLQQSATFDESVVTVDSLSLDVLAVCSLPTNPSELLASAEMKNMLATACDTYDQIILDTPACLGLPDGKTVSELSDGVILVVRADVTRQDDVEAVLEILDRRRLIGMVLNGVEATRGQYGYY